MCAQFQVLSFFAHCNLKLSSIVNDLTGSNTGESSTEFKKTKCFSSALHLLSMISVQHCIAELTSQNYNNVLDIQYECALISTILLAFEYACIKNYFMGSNGKDMADFLPLKVT